MLRSGSLSIKELEKIFLGVVLAFSAVSLAPAIFGTISLEGNGYRLLAVLAASVMLIIAFYLYFSVRKDMKRNSLRTIQARILNERRNGEGKSEYQKSKRRRIQQEESRRRNRRR